MSGASQGIGPAADRLAHVTGVLDVSSRRDLAGCGSARGSDGAHLAAGASAPAAPFWKGSSCDPRKWLEVHVTRAVALKREGYTAATIAGMLTDEFGTPRTADSVRKMLVALRNSGASVAPHDRAKAALSAHKRMTLERAANLSVRSCMRCRAGFSSEGIHNRICSPCKLSADFQGLGA